MARRALALVVVAALLTAFSEAFYWYSGGTGFLARTLVYLIPATILLWALATFRPLSWPAVILAGAVYGFVVEGVLTTIVYGGFPLDPFAISYTSLAWHALISVAFGLVLAHRLLVRGPVPAAAGGFAAFGVFWGIWAMSLRLPPDPDAEPAGLSALVGDVGVGAFAAYTLAATAVVGLCHLSLGRLVRPADLVPRRPWLWVACIAGGVWFAILVLPAVPWAPLELAALLAVCVWGLRTLADTDRTRAGALDAVCDRVPVARLGLLAALPVSATVTYAALVEASLDDPTIRALFLDAIVWTQMLAGWAVFAWALWSAARCPRASQDRG